jgi:hypothetical protein
VVVVVVVAAVVVVVVVAAEWRPSGGRAQALGGGYDLD